MSNVECVWRPFCLNTDALAEVVECSGVESAPFRVYDIDDLVISYYPFGKTAASTHSAIYVKASAVVHFKLSVNDTSVSSGGEVSLERGKGWDDFFEIPNTSARGEVRISFVYFSGYRVLATERSLSPLVL